MSYLLHGEYEYVKKKKSSSSLVSVERKSNEGVRPVVVLGAHPRQSGR